MNFYSYLNDVGEPQTSINNDHNAKIDYKIYTDQNMFITNTYSILGKITKVDKVFFFYRVSFTRFMKLLLVTCWPSLC